MTAKFTDSYLRNLSTEPPRYVWDELLPAFGIYVGKRKKTFVTIDAKGKRTTLGHYPLLSLSDARRAAIAATGTPSTQAPTITFLEAKSAFLAQAHWRPSTRRVTTSSLAYFKWSKPLADITHNEVVTALETITAPSARFHAFKDLRALFNWAIPRYLATNPCQGIKLPQQPTRERVLSDDELRALWSVLDDSGAHAIVRLCLLTGQRRGEVPHMTLTDGIITIPAQYTKNNRSHSFPVGHLTERYFTQATYTNWGFAKERLDRLSGVTDWTVHDLRRTFASNHARLGTPIHIIEKLLNHVSGSLSGVAGVYNRYTYLAEMKEAVTRYENWLESEVLRQVKT